MAAIREAIARHLGDLQALQGPAEFLGHIAWMSGSSMPNVRTDFGLAHYLVGNIQESARIFRSLKVELAAVKQRRHDPIADVVGLVTEQLESDAEGLLALIDGWRDDNLENARAISFEKDTAAIGPRAIRLARAEGK